MGGMPLYPQCNTCSFSGTRTSFSEFATIIQLSGECHTDFLLHIKNGFTSAGSIFKEMVNVGKAFSPSLHLKDSLVPLSNQAL